MFKMYGKTRVKIETVCPRCLGTGYARAFNREKKYDKEICEKAEELFKQDLTLREIGKKLKIKHPQTVKNILIYSGAMEKFKSYRRKRDGKY